MANTVEIIIKAFDATKGGFNSALKGVGGMSNALVALGKVTAVAGTAFAGAMAVMVIKSIEAADQLNDLSKRTGISVENLDRLGFAASQSGASMDQLVNAAKFLNKSLADSVVNPSGEAANALAAMGISARDASGNMKSADAVMLEMANRFESYADGANKVALAQKLLGKSGEEMIPFLNEGGSAIQKMGDNMRPVSTAAAQMADEFNDTIGRIARKFVDFGNEVTEKALPSLNLLAKWFEEFIGKAYEKSLNSITDAMKSMTDAIGAARAYFGDVEEQFGQALAESFKKNVTEGLSSAVKAADLPPLPSQREDAPSIVNTRDSKKLAQMYDDLFVSQLKGSERVSLQWEEDHKKRVASIQEMQVSIEEGAKFEALSEKTLWDLRAEYARSGNALKDDLDEQYNQGSLQKTQELLSGEAAMRLANLENNRAMLDIMLEQWRAKTEAVSLMWARVGLSIQNGAFKGVQSSVEGLIKGTMSASEAMKNLGKSILDSVVSAFSEMIAKLLIMRSLGFIFGGGGFLGKIFGFKDGGFTGFASGGFTGFGSMDNVAGVVHKNEYVLPAQTTESIGIPTLDRIRALGEAGMLGEGGGGGPTAVNVYMDGVSLFRAIGNASRNGLLEISASAVV